MMEPGMCELAPPPTEGAFDAPPTVTSELARRLARKVASHTWVSLQVLCKFLGMACVLALLLPLLLIASAVSLVVARVLGVPLLAATSPPFRLR